MQKADVMPRLESVFRDQFNDASLQINDETSSMDIADWDSLANVRLLIAIEQEFNCQFDTDELSGLQSVGAIVDSILNKNS